ncbi:dTTP/UTP pyrophosphatase-like [Sycon ciliatum]|uniref:dTTP/UTP pyrophosphatase-like n=1 Tax=Sycon ciliatum TaxID=27933 RepID=UPI0020AEA6AA|eukprot:scpid94596/ scgid32520/ N-acetylserotonin O-methyltransferase-like protein
MIGPLLQKLNATRVCLASGSPRRRELLNVLGMKFEVIPSEFDERSLQKPLFPHPSKFVEESSRCKANEVLERAGSNLDVIIAADTVLSFQGDILEKPIDSDDAVRMLTRLSGQSHYVYTGVTIISLLESRAEPKIVTFHECTQVFFADLPQAVIAAYVDTKEPLDKAGSYGIQGRGGALVKRIEGDYFNVVGLPIHKVSCQLVDLLS